MTVFATFSFIETETVIVLDVLFFILLHFAHTLTTDHDLLFEALNFEGLMQMLWKPRVFSVDSITDINDK